MAHSLALYVVNSYQYKQVERIAGLLGDTTDHIFVSGPGCRRLELMLDSRFQGDAVTILSVSLHEMSRLCKQLSLELTCI